MAAVLLVALPVMGIIALVDAASSSEDAWQEDTDHSTSPTSMRELEKKWAKRGTWK